jgi:acyl-CoA thioester hydrolase
MLRPPSYAVRVLGGDIDHMGHVNNSVYLRWLEEAVLAYWRTIATADDLAAYRWIAVRHEIDYRQPAFLDEEVTVDLQLTEIRRARAWFQSRFTRDGRVLAEARSCWCTVDAGSHRLVPVPPRFKLDDASA